MMLPQAVLLAAAVPAVFAQLQPFANNTQENLDFAQSPPKYPSPVSLPRKNFQQMTRAERVHSGRLY